MAFLFDFSSDGVRLSDAKENRKELVNEEYNGDTEKRKTKQNKSLFEKGGL